MELFKFSNYDKKLTKKTEISIDLSGIPVQSEGIVSSKDSDGNVTESKVTEKVDEKQNFIFTGKIICSGDSKLNQVAGKNILRYHVTSPSSITATTPPLTTVSYTPGERVVTEIPDIIYGDDANIATLTVHGTHPKTNLAIEYQLEIVPRHLYLYDWTFTLNPSISSITMKDIAYGKDNKQHYRVYEVVTNGQHNLPYWQKYAVTNDLDDYYARQSKLQYIVNFTGSSIPELNNDKEILSVINETTFRIKAYTSVQTVSTLPTIGACRYRWYRQTSRYPLLDRSVYAACGLWDNRNYSIGYESGLNPSHKYGADLGLTDANATGYLNYKEYKKYLKSLSKNIADNGIEILNTEYLPKMVNGVDVYDSNIPRYEKGFNLFGADATDFKYVKNKGLSFITKNITELPSTQMGPGNVSVKELFRAQFESANQLQAEMMHYLLSVSSSLSQLPIPESFVDLIFNTSFLISFTLSEQNPIKYLKADEKEPKDAVYPREYTTSKKIAYKYKDQDNNDTYITQKKLVIAPKSSIKNIIQVTKEAIDRFTGAQVAMLVLVSPTVGIMMQITGNEVRTLKGQIEETERKIKWYEKFTNESVFDNKEYLGSWVNNGVEVVNPMHPDIFSFDKKLARLLLPVDFGVRKKKVTNKHNKVVTKKEDIGIRWVDISFVDSATLDNHRASEEIQGTKLSINKPIVITDIDRPSRQVSSTNSTDVNINVPSHGIADTVTNFTVTVSGYTNTYYNGTYPAIRLDDNNIRYTVIDSSKSPSLTISTGGIVESAIIPLAPTQPSDKRTQVRIDYSMPHLPTNNQLIKKIFQLYGPVDQSKFANRSRSGNYTVTTETEGFEIFPSTSKTIESMRSGIDVYNKVAFLMKLLITEFGESRVKLIETLRSVVDQDKLQLGGPSSVFLSWHNFGLGARIVIKSGNLVDSIEEGSSDFFRYMDIAETFIDACAVGYLGTPCNVVWCAQLMTNPDIFSWEFLPIGTNHKDAWKYRDSVLNQRDPIKDYSYVNVDDNKMVVNAQAPTYKNTAFIRSNSSAYLNAIIINTKHYVSPFDIKNYPLPKNIVLKDIQEFLYLVKVKMDANGTKLTGDKNVRKWKNKNPHSYKQLVYYYGMTGNTANAIGLLSGEYVDQYEGTVVTSYSTDPIKFVKDYLGESRYNSARIYIDTNADGSYISLKTGRMTAPVLEIRSIIPEGNGNTFLEKQAGQNNIEYGQYQKGVFIPKDDSRIVASTSSTPVISGYDYDIATGEFYAVDEDAKMVHYMVAQQIFEEYSNVKSTFDKLNIKFMYDNFTSSANYGRTRTLENEYGIIDSQDIITIPQLRAMYNRLVSKIAGDGTVLGIGVNIEAQEGKDRNEEQSVYEKLISNAQLSGARKAKLTKENIIMEDLKNDVTIEKVVKFIQKATDPDVKSIR